jgi:L-ascorbate metabolism protein UlaG (beta-lactamase superfamily)
MTKKLFHFIHHAAFWVEVNGKRALFDPYLDGNPEGLSAKDVKADWIFISHAHSDHLGNAFEIARQNGATIISTAEVCGLAANAGCKAHAMHVGGTFSFNFGKVRLTPAFHGSGVAGGHACGFIVNFYGAKFYFAGDTGLFGDMKWLREVEPFDVAILPIGGNFTMDPEDAARAAAWLEAPFVIPVHYNTWPVIAQDVAAFKAKVEEKTKTKVIIVSPGETIEIP